MPRVYFLEKPVNRCDQGLNFGFEVFLVDFGPKKHVLEGFRVVPRGLLVRSTFTIITLKG